MRLSNGRVFLAPGIALVLCAWVPIFAIGAVEHRDCPGWLKTALGADVEVNRNAHVALENYKQTNDRNFVDYIGHLGDRFKRRFPTETWLDVGAGYGLAALEAIRLSLVQQAVVVNAQDALGPIRNENIRWFNEHFLNGIKSQEDLMMKLDIVSRLFSFAPDVVDNAQIVTGLKPGVWKLGAIGRLVEGGAKRLAELESAGKFIYQVGLAEAVLPKMTKKFGLITDPFGAYFYSAQRLKLISDYYDRLAEDGEALVIFHGRDIEWHDDASTGRKTAFISEFGPKSFIRRKNGQIQRLEDYLIELYPTIFSVETSNVDQSYPSARNDILVIKFDPKIKDLGILASLEIESTEFGIGEFNDQIPNVIYRE